jgi:transposase
MFNLERGLGHMSISELTFKSKDELVRRFEVFTGNGRRRDWSDVSAHFHAPFLGDVSAA